MSAAVVSGSRKGTSSTRSTISWARVGIEVGFWVLLSVATVLVAWLDLGGLAAWLGGTLAYGWVAVALYAVVGLAFLLHRRGAFVRHWRWWILGTIAIVAAVIGLSVVRGSSGALYTYGFAGAWGYALTGGNPVAAAVQLAVSVMLAGLLVIPNGARHYYSVLRRIGIGVWWTLKKVGVATARVFSLAGRGTIVAGNGAVKLGALTRRARTPASAEPPRNRKSPRVAAPREPDEVAPMPVSIPAPAGPAARSSAWQLPPVDVLAPAEPHHIDQAAIAHMSDEIIDALSEHGVYVDVEEVKAGPRVFRFGLVPGYMPEKIGRDGGRTGQRPSRVRVGDIAKRQKDLALALKSPYIRIIETPEPGEGLVGLEVPNPSPGKVLMRSIVEGAEFQKIVSKGGLAFALGEDAGGQSLVLDLAAMPHLLIAGATGSGKSVCINSLVASLLMTRPPDELRMIMVDPKRVELTPFNGIPHLALPVIVEPDEVYPALRGLINEMTRRYRMMEAEGARNIAGYNAKAADPMPFLVLIVDELADLMMTGGLEVEQQLVRLAQLGRAAGIHMVLATQRPSVKVVTGLLKANVPARVAFAVASQVDSRVILDGAGAEALMGRGDLLLLNNDFPKARRGQGTLVYDEETDRITQFWRQQAGPPLPPLVLDDIDGETAPGEPAGGADPDQPDAGGILDQARDLALRNPRLSSEMLERRLKIRKSIADEIIEELKGEGLVVGS